MGFLGRLFDTIILADMMKRLFGSNESHHSVNADSPYEPYLHREDDWLEEERLEDMEDEEEWQEWEREQEELDEDLDDMMMYEDDFLEDDF